MFLSMLLLAAPLSPARPALPPPVAAAAPLPPPVAAPEPEEKPLTYAQARVRAVEEGKPLVVWVGGNFCERCVRESAADFVHCFVDKFEGVAAPAIVVGVSDGGELVRAGDVTWWVEGDREFGHVPSVRAVIRRWLELREQNRRAGAVMMGPAVVHQPVVVQPPVQVRVAQPRVRFVRSAECGA